jgi:quercetin dioxygenase-like cupin family protein
MFAVDSSTTSRVLSAGRTNQAAFAGGVMFVRAAERPIAQVEPGITRQVLGHDDQLMMVRITFRRGAAGALHEHPHRQVTYVESGRFEATVDGKTTVLSAGDCFFVAPHAVHGAVALEDGALIDVFAPAREDFIT